MTRPANRRLAALAALAAAALALDLLTGAGPVSRAGLVAGGAGFKGSDEELQAATGAPRPGPAHTAPDRKQTPNPRDQR